MSAPDYPASIREMLSDGVISQDTTPEVMTILEIMPDICKPILDVVYTAGQIKGAGKMKTVADEMNESWLVDFASDRTDDIDTMKYSPEVEQ